MTKAYFHFAAGLLFLTMSAEAQVITNPASGFTKETTADIGMGTSFSSSWRKSFSATTGNDLSLKLLTFTGKSIPGENELDWTTEDEQGLKGFIPERSYDGITFDSIGHIPANGLDAAAYTYKDVDVPAGWLYYRLRVVGTSGSASYSRTVKLNGGTSAVPDVFIYPNPVVDKLYLNPGGNKSTGNIRITNILGRTSLDMPFSALVSRPDGLEMDVQVLSSGIYQLEWTDADGKLIAKGRFVRR